MNVCLGMRWCVCICVKDSELLCVCAMYETVCVYTLRVCLICVFFIL